MTEKLLFEALLLINSVNPVRTGEGIHWRGVRAGLGALDLKRSSLVSYCDRTDTTITYEESAAKSKSMDYFCNLAKDWRDKENPNEIKGLFVPNVGIFKIVQQPANDPEYVSAIKGVFTQFQMAKEHGVIGLLSHANIDGERVVGHMKVGDVFAVSDGRGEIRWFEVGEVDFLDTITPDDSKSDFIDPKSGKILSVEKVFERYYTDSSKDKQKVILQTCVYDEKMVNTGREFVEAREIEEPEIADGNVLSYRSDIQVNSN